MIKHAKNTGDRSRGARIISRSRRIFLFCSFLLAISVTLLLSLPVRAEHASLYLSPPSGTYTVDSTFSIKVQVNSGGEDINAAEGTLIFNPDEITVASLSKSSSIFTLWTTEPTFSNSRGNIVFGGGAPDSFSGTSGTIITITFKAKALASAQVAFSAGSVLAADGKGTNILGSMNGGVYTFKAKIITPPAEEVPPEAEYIPPATPGGAPGAPVVSSVTHPDPDKWYSNNDPEFFWTVPPDITAVKLLIGHLPTSLPAVFYSPPISEKKLENLADGVWYFHIRFSNRYGWGGIVHRKVLIDTEAPESFEIEIDNGGDATNPSPILYFESKDALSGIEFYEILIDGKMIATAATMKENPYKMPPQPPGEHTIIVKAIDRAGNSTAASASVTIEAIEMPVITDFPRTIRVGDILTIKGTSVYPESAITVFVKKEGEEVIANDVKTDSEGNWLYIHPKSLEKGTYQIWAIAIDSRGAKSNPTDKITIAVTLPTILKFGKIAIDYISVMITLASLIIVLIGVMFYAWYRFSFWRRRLRKETGEVEESMRRAFEALRDEVEEQLEMLDKKPGLSKKEKAIRDKLQEALDVSEKFIGKEIKDVEKELE